MRYQRHSVSRTVGGIATTKSLGSGELCNALVRVIVRLGVTSRKGTWRKNAGPISLLDGSLPWFIVGPIEIHRCPCILHLYASQRRKQAARENAQGGDDFLPVVFRAPSGST
jgi:hypothetical protein